MGATTEGFAPAHAPREGDHGARFEPRARADRAMALVRARAHAAAIEAYEELLAERPGDVPLTFNLGVAYLAAGYTAHAARAFREVLHAHPDHARARALASFAERGGAGAWPESDGVRAVGPASTHDVQAQSEGVLLLRVAPGAGWTVCATALFGTVGAVEQLDGRVFGLGRAIVRGRAHARGLRLESGGAHVRTARLLAWGDGLAVRDAGPARREPMTELRGR